MGLSRGDRVKFLNDTGGGIIAGFRDEKTAMVVTADGFEVPVPVKELILTGKQQNASYESRTESAREPEKHDLPPGRHGGRKDDPPGETAAGEQPESDNRRHPLYSAKSKSPETVNSKGGTEIPVHTPDEHSGLTVPEKNLLIAFVETGSAGKLDAWLINDSRYNVLYNLMIKHDEYYRTLKAGMMEADTKIFIGGFGRDQLNAFVSFRLQAVFFLKGVFNPVSPSQGEFTVDPALVYGAGLVSGNDFFEEKACIIPVISEVHEREIKKVSELEIARIIAAKEQKDPPEIKKEKPDPLVEEVDLHIEQLVDDHTGMSGREVLDAQMTRFTTALEGAIRGNTRRIIFIHGVGNGKLKFELRKTLDRKYPRLKYQDASFREYGYGATMVIVR